MKSPAEDDNFICSVCGQSFKDEGYLKNHLKIRHPGVKFVESSKIHQRQKSDTVPVREDKNCVRKGCGKRSKYQDCVLNSAQNQQDGIKKGGMRNKNILETHCVNSTVDEQKASKVSLSCNKCVTCKKVFTTKKALTRHMKNHEREKYKCKLCEEKFDRQDHLIHHKRTFHTGHENPHYQTRRKETYKCSVCRKIFKLKTNFEMHVKNHASKPADRYECVVCEKWFDSAAYLQKHAAAHAKGKSYKCNVCGKAFKYNVSYCRHMLSHPSENSEQSFACTECNKSFAKSYLLKSHEIVVHRGNKRFQCQVCTKSFHSKFSLQKHTRSHLLQERKFLCDICGKSFKQKTSANRHQSMHSDDQTPRCCVCGEAFQLKSHLAKHIKLHPEHGLGRVKSKTSQFHSWLSHNVIRLTSFTCRICSKVMTSAKCLAYHMQTHHGKEKYSCAFCDKIFYKHNVLKAHMKVIHKQISKDDETFGKNNVIRLGDSKKNLFQCPLCSLIFIHNNELDTHLRIHSGQKPYECKSCRETFNGRLYLHKHTNTCDLIPRKKPHWCSVCGKQWGSNAELKRHMVMHTGERNYPCQHCGLAFGRKGNLLAHVKRKHSHRDVSSELL